ncbi:MAG: hypothetical protein JNJ65_14780 [Cyclobacteriaceae bacterium]|nr:hypothetical protein [Cyclobacteriaceae bacterium]
MSKRQLLLVLFMVSFLVTKAQEVSVAGRFEGDTVKLGEPIRYFLTARYPQQYQLLFPDSTFAFTPFEFLKKQFVVTKTQNGISYDSAVYTLATFEIDSLQLLTLPVFRVQGQDCLTYLARTDTVFFKELVQTVPDSLAANQLPLKTNTAYSPVSWILNYPLLLIVGGGSILLAIIGWIAFGKKIRKYFTLKRLHRSHQAFLNQFEKSVEVLKNQFSPERAESSVTLWKQYMEELSALPYTKFTSREILERDSSDLKQALQSVDRMVYGRMSPTTLDSFHQLKDFTQSRFNKKIEEVKHG